MHASTYSQVNPSDVINDLILRKRNAGALGSSGWASAFPEASDEQLLTSVQVYLAEEAGKPKLSPSFGTTIACTNCARLNAPAYYLKRSHGRYSVLCFDHGNGCWEHSTRVNCSYVDQHSAQCVDLAEWVVAYGPDMLKERHVCAIHVAGVLGDSTEHRIFPLQD
jgi:hypothetical protein